MFTTLLVSMKNWVREERKSIFIRYSKYLKGYVFLGEQVDESVTEFESHDAIFLEDVYHSRGEV